MTITGPDGLQRPQPRAAADGRVFPARLMRTYRIMAPLRSHWRKATCAEYECDAWRFGWVTTVPADSAAADYIRHDRTRSWREERCEGGLARFTFPAGQQGFAGPEHDHRLRTGRPERFLQLKGDWRRTADPVELRAEDWADSFANNMDSVARQIEKG